MNGFEDTRTFGKRQHIRAPVVDEHELARGERSRRELWKRSAWQWGAWVLVVVACVRYSVAENSQHWVTRLGYLCVVAALVYTARRLYLDRSPGDPPDPAQGSWNNVDVHRAQLRDQARLLRNATRVYFAPLLPGVAMTFMGASLEHPSHWPFSSLSFAVATASLLFLTQANRSQANEFARRADGIGRSAAVRPNILDFS